MAQNKQTKCEAVYKYTPLPNRRVIHLHNCRRLLGHLLPIATGLSGPEQILGLQIAQHSESELLRQQRDEVALEQRLDGFHHVPHLAGVAAVDQLVDCLDLLHVGPVVEP